MAVEFPIQIVLKTGAVTQGIKAVDKQLGIVELTAKDVERSLRKAFDGTSASKVNRELAGTATSIKSVATQANRLKTAMGEFSRQSQTGLRSTAVSVKSVAFEVAKLRLGANELNRQSFTELTTSFKSVEVAAKKLQGTLSGAFQDVRLNQLRRDLTNTTVRLKGVGAEAAKLKRITSDLNRQPLSRLQRSVNTVGNAFRRASRTAVSALQRIKREVVGARLEVGGLGSAIAAVGTAAGIRGIINTGRSFQNLQRRVLSVSESAVDARASFDLIRTVSDETGTSLETNAATFQRLTVATRQLGIGSARTAGLLKTLNQAFVIGGASAQEASSALTQLGQGLASNRLQGDELRSLLENAPLLAEKLSEQLGITTGELREMGAAGELTAETLVVALEGAAESIDEAFKGLGPSLDQSLQRLDNAFLDLGEALQPFIENLSTSLGFVTDLVKEVGKLANTFKKLPGADASQQAKTGAASQTLISELINNALIASGPIGAAIGLSRGTPDFAAQAAQQTPQDIFRQKSLRLGNELGVFDPSTDVGPQIAEFRRQLQEAGTTIEEIDAAIAQLTDKNRDLGLSEVSVANSLGVVTSSLNNVVLSTEEAAKVTTDLIVVRTKSSTAQKEAALATAKEAVERRKLTRSLKGQVQALQNQSRLIGVEGVEREALVQRIRAEEAIRRKKLDVTSAEAKVQLEIIEGLARENAQRREALRIQKEQASAQAESGDTGEGLGAGFGGVVGPDQDAISDAEAFTLSIQAASEAASELGEIFATTLVGGVDAAANAIAQFAIDGARDFDSLKKQLSSIFADISKQILAAIIKALILRAISGLTGSTGTAAGTGAFEGFQGDTGAGLDVSNLAATGSTTANSGRSYTVNEGGREMFVSSTSNLSQWASSRSTARKTRSPRTRLGGRQGGGAVIPGGGALTGFTPPSAGQIIPAADTARMLNQDRGGSKPTIIQAPAPAVTVNVEPRFELGGKVLKQALREDEELQGAIVTVVAENQAGIQQGGR